MFSLATAAIEKKPSGRMEVGSFDEDLLERSEVAARLTAFIAVERQFVPGGLVLALNGRFGSGKSTFLKMWKQQLEGARAGSLGAIVVLLNAWESDYCGDPLFALVSGLLDKLESEHRQTGELRRAIGDVLWFGIGIGAQVINKVAGVNPIEAGEFAKKRKSENVDASGDFQDAFEITRKRISAMARLRAEIEKAVSVPDGLVYFFVDELDRCRPDYAIAYLETIKHVFDVRGAVFVLAADREHLENSAKTAFGVGLNFNEYYRRFVHREFALPQVGESGYKKMASAYVACYLVREGTRECGLKLGPDKAEEIAALLGALKLTPRQMQEVFRIVGHLMATTGEHRGRLLWAVGEASVLMAALYVGSPKMFHLLGNGELDPREAARLFRESLPADKLDWWFMLCLSGGGLKVPKEWDSKGELVKLGIVARIEDAEGLLREGSWRSGWGGLGQKGFCAIHDKITSGNGFWNL